MKQPAAIVIQHLTPELDCGKFPLKRAVGGDLCIEADIFKEGCGVLRAVLKWRFVGEKVWNEGMMFALENNRWRGAFPLLKVGMWEYTIEAWQDEFLSWQQEICKKFDGGMYELRSEALEGSQFIETAAQNAGATTDASILEKFSETARQANTEQLHSLCKDPKLIALMMYWGERSLSAVLLPTRRVRVDRQRAVFAAWYEFFPRSAEGKAESGSTLRNCLNRIDDAKEMGFDVVYFPPVHPIGETNRKGRNNAPRCMPGDPGVPYAIGNFRQGEMGGGHRDIAPELGTLRDFEWLVSEVHKRGMEVALDFAINCSPDHPYLRDHPEWFFWRPDGSIKCAENPPKRYEDVFPLNFYAKNWRILWEELFQVLLFWCARGVLIFRVDNPHTKPIFFWEWIISKVQEKYPQAIFLSEAFTHQKMMQLLAKVGFTQSYTYFTWRNTKRELMEYFTELTQSEMKEFFRPNLFTNTPDILPYFLQRGGRAGFQIRAILAATLATVYGIYSGFELCENAAIPGGEEYLNSEKYQFKERDWNAPENIKNYLTALNRIRRENRALRFYESLRFYPADNDQILFYSKSTPSKNNVLLVVVSLDPHKPQSAYVNVPLEEFGYVEQDTYQLEDLLSGERFSWARDQNYVALNPSCPAHILRLRR
ncbi:alpha-1,4-glucan--maltose-1-phosphate maltosyltransferase [Candidatus Xiphinematobacter sp. Idaho Grape]|uniref:alpha-1,4-glucan--maltose-1-phosphate maltosyltransferase n=1 Tax=Candidatus Xiphinematobacter sp. Idaho Grape TaxID=1704307 RepID=UPI0009E7E340|nr:alpha-1,4-glucan--maltose-1-phosphate maltosyltransferase [Candidatus Xiphinematobacter sp. Idaho Grape]